MQIDKDHLNDALSTTLDRYPEARGAMIFFITALGLRQKDPNDREVMHWAYKAAQEIEHNNTK